MDAPVFLGLEHRANTARTTWNQPNEQTLLDLTASTLSDLSAVVESASRAR